MCMQPLAVSCKRLKVLPYTSCRQCNTFLFLVVESFKCLSMARVDAIAMY